MNVRLALDDTTIYATEFTLFQDHNTIHEIEINEGYTDINLDPFIEKRLKAEREKVWEVFRAIAHNLNNGGMASSDVYECFGSHYSSCISEMPVDEVLEKYESWKKTHDVEEVIKSLKPQDVVAYNSGIDFDYRILMITRVIALDGGKRYTFDGITRDGRSTIIYISIDDSKFTVVKIGRVVETTDILGEIKKIEDEWRKNN